MMTKTTDLLVIIPAAGIGKRYSSDYPKQYVNINGMSVIERAVKPFIDSDYVSKIILVISKNDSHIKNQNFYDSEKVEFVSGGDTRQESINNALKEVSDNYKYVITHDAARPNVIEADIEKLYEDIKRSNASCSFFYTPVYDSIKKIGSTEKTEDKKNFILVQTPQISKLFDLKKAIQKCINENIDSPDESFAIEYSNLKLSKIKGRRSNIKITEAEDEEVLNKFLVRSGSGFDLHKYDKGSGIILGGYKIDCKYKIIAHSDGDVLLHSIADSILGASGQGDIGHHFSDQEEENRDMNSAEIIKFCLKKLNDLNLEIYNIDTTIICEQPKINPHRQFILKNLSDILGIPTSRIGLKATTSEKIGIIGENKAIAVQSLVNLRDKI